MITPHQDIFITHLIEPFSYLFKIDANEYLTVTDMTDIIMLAKETLHSVAKHELHEDTFSESVRTNAMELFISALNVQHFESSLPKSAMYNFELRVVKYVVNGLFCWFEHCSSEDMLSHDTLFESIVDEIYILYGMTTIVTEPTTIAFCKSWLDATCPVNPNAAASGYDILVRPHPMVSTDDTFFGM